MESVVSTRRSRAEAKSATISSTLVETISINYEDFSESFLTCSTCLCTYDGCEHTPKLLPCSHTVCLLCLSRIVQSSRSPSSSFRCPICRESITVPQGGVAALPPSFLVNQLLDLMARQRREVVPECANHPGRELLFCESCDSVFCTRCTDGLHGTAANGAGGSHTSLAGHTVVPFSIAIKRMSEILLYKANEVAAKLSAAEESVRCELDHLEQSHRLALQTVDEAFGRLEQQLLQAKRKAADGLAEVAAGKAQLLQRQLELIREEQSVVARDVADLQFQIEVRSLGERIAALQNKLDAVSTLQEPRENSYLTYELLDKSGRVNELLRDVSDSVGRPVTSKALASLSTLSLVGTADVATHHAVCGLIQTVDYEGVAQKRGGDPVRVSIESAAGASGASATPVDVVDAGDGTYRFWLRPSQPGPLVIRASLFGRSLKHSPLTLDVTNQQQVRRRTVGCKAASTALVQPSGVATLGGHLYVLDAGNERLAKYRVDHLDPVGFVKSAALEGRSATGMCAGADTSTLWLANWKRRQVCQIEADSGRLLKCVTLPELQEPVDVALSDAGHLLIADAHQSAVLVVSLAGAATLLGRCGQGPGTADGQFQAQTLRAVTCATGHQVVAADARRLQVFSSDTYRHVRTLAPTLTKGQWGGVAFQSTDGLLLASYTDPANRASRCGIWVLNFGTGEPFFHFESVPAQLKRPGRLCTLLVDLGAGEDAKNAAAVAAAGNQLKPHHAAYLYVCDVADDCVKQYRFL